MTSQNILRFYGWLFLALIVPAQAVINAGLQPYDLFKSRYSRALVLEVTAVEASGLKCKVVKSIKGKDEAKPEIDLQFEEALVEVLESAVADGDIKVGDPIAVFAGRKRATKDFMLYANSFYLGKIQEPGVWKINRTGQGATGTSGEQLNTLAGTWNGATPQLIKLLEDAAAERDHFPRKAYVRFQEDVLLDKLDGPVTALAVFDIEGDGDDDVVACSEKGDRIYLQTDPMVFVNATEKFGLDSKSLSCALADANGDGLNDLLAGAVLYQGQFAENKFTFKKTDFLPASLAADLKTATFVDLNGDGHPDVLASVKGQGLKIFQNPGKKGGGLCRGDPGSGFGSSRMRCGHRCLCHSGGLE